MKNSPEFTIGNRLIGPDHPPLVIAEIGINHEGSLETAFEMVDAASRAGIEVVKHQTHIASDEMSKAAREITPGNDDSSIYHIIDRCSLNQSDERLLKEYVEKKGMIFISTPFSRAAANRLSEMDVPAFKIGSGECNNYPLLEYIVSFEKPVILSTGMNDIDSIRKAVKIFEEYSVPLALLHTTNLYPTPPHLVRLGALQKMQSGFPERVIGLSDHTTSNHACFAAVALGSSILERHFTDHMQRYGPDIINSMDENSARDLIEGSNMIWKMRGGEKEATPEEKVTIDFAFASVVSLKPIRAGDVLSVYNVWVKRPGTGEIPAEHYNDLIGKVAAKDIAEDEHFSWDDIVT